MKIQTKIALIFTVICTFIVMALSGAVYFFSYEKAFQDFYTRLELRAVIAAKANLDSGLANTQAYEEVRNQHLQRLPQEEEYIIRLDTLERFTATAPGKRLPPAFYRDVVQNSSVSYRKEFRFYKGIRYRNAKGNHIIILTAVNTYAQNFLNNLKSILAFATLFSLLVIFTAGMFFSRQILAPIRWVAREVHNISATSLNKRLPARSGTDEIAELTNTFNNMLARLETSFETQNNFVSNASHELNTPLTAIIGEAEFALSKTRSTEQYEQGLQVILAQAEKLRHITGSLLELAQSGFSGNLSFEWIKVADLLHSVRQVAKSIYPDCRLATDESLYPADLDQLGLNGNFHLLELCISNILLNACKYANGQRVTLALAASDRHLVFIIRDQGIGIPERDIPHIFDPFFRASNVQGAKGYGIGLPLAQNIIRLHHGTIQIASREQEGTEVVIKIPKSSDGRQLG